MKITIDTDMMVAGINEEYEVELTADGKCFEKLQEENAELKDKIDKLEKGLSFKSDAIDRLFNTNRMLRIENATLRDKLTELKKSLEKVEYNIFGIRCSIKED